MPTIFDLAGVARLLHVALARVEAGLPDVRVDRDLVAGVEPGRVIGERGAAGVAEAEDGPARRDDQLLFAASYRTTTAPKLHLLRAAERLAPSALVGAVGEPGARDGHAPADGRPRRAWRCARCAPAPRGDGDRVRAPILRDNDAGEVDPRRLHRAARSRRAPRRRRADQSSSCESSPGSAVRETQWCSTRDIDGTCRSLRKVPRRGSPVLAEARR